MPTPSPLMSRDEFSNKTKELLARRAGFRCSICKSPTVGPHSKSGKTVFLGEASHIYSAGHAGPRANPMLTSDQRSDLSNGIHLCKAHARLIDVDTQAYTAERLIKIKLAHEQEMRGLIVGRSVDYDPDFLNSHESQVVHGRGSPSLSDLWVSRQVAQPRLNQPAAKVEATTLLSIESGVLLIVGEQWTGRTCLLKRMAAQILGQKNCVWLNGRELTETALRDPIRLLAEGYRKLNVTEDGWKTFLEADQFNNFIFIDDLHLAPVNIAARRRFLCFLKSFSHLITAAASGSFLIELLGVSTNDGLQVNQWGLVDLPRADCAKMIDKWCRFHSDSIADSELDVRVASAEDQVELLFGKKLMPRQPLFVLTALQMIDAGSPIDTAVGSFGGVYETVIHLAISKNAPNQAAISSERAYLEELAYWCESQPEHKDRKAFNNWFGERKAVKSNKIKELEEALLAKGFLARQHQGFRFNYQKYYFQASFIRSNPDRAGVKAYVSKLIKACWNEDYANTALFLAYLQPSSSLVQAFLDEMQGLFRDQKEFEMRDWKVEISFPKNFFRGLNFSGDPEANRRLLAERLDEKDPVKSSECEVVSSQMTREEDDQSSLDYLKSFHLIKLVGQLIRNSPVAFDADQKKKLVQSSFDLSLRMASFANQVCSPSALQSQALNQLREKILKRSDRVQLEAALSGLIYQVYLFVIFSVLKHASYYLAHPDLTLTYDDVLKVDSSDPRDLSYRVLECGLGFELRSVRPDALGEVFDDLPPAGRDFLQVWTWLFLSFNRVPVSKRQVILESVEMTPNTQLLLPKPRGSGVFED